ncbi:MAG: hypothetical protein ACI89U_001647 [Gammaproteobacteria bacterium]|jgi:hypothetical protein
MNIYELKSISETSTCQKSKWGTILLKYNKGAPKTVLLGAFYRLPYGYYLAYWLFTGSYGAFLFNSIFAVNNFFDCDQKKTSVCPAKYIDSRSSLATGTL